MGVFYLISLPMTLGMVVITLKYFAAPHVRLYVFFTVGYAWFCSLSIIFIVPADIWTTMVNRQNWVIAFFWSWSYWSTFLLTWAVVPLLQDYEDAGDFTVAERLKTSIHRNLVFYLIVGSIGLIGLILLVIMQRNLRGGALGFAMACSNTFGLVTGAFLLGFGLSEIPRSLWKKADWTFRQKALSHKIADMAVKLDDAHRNFSNAIVVAQATSNQMSKRDPLRPCMDVIDKMVAQMFKEDPSFKPQGGRLGENDMDYDADVKSMSELRRQLRVAQEQYYRYKSEYMTCVLEALELEDTIKNYEQRDATGWFVALLSMTFIIFPLLLPCLPQTDLIFRQSLTGGFIVSRHKKYISSLRGTRPGNVGSILDTAELLWRCILRKQLQRLLSIILGCMSVAILLAEATLLPSVDLSLFSILIKSAHRHELLVQVFAFIPLMYMCVCTYYSLFKVGMMAFYSLTPRQTSSVSLFMIVSMVARYAPPISYNFLNLIRLDGNAKTIFEQRMGNIDDAVPFFGTGFNRLYPLIMVIYTILVASNFFDRIIGFFGSWKILKFQSEADDVGGFDPSGMIILHRERLWLEQGHKVGEQVIPLARNFSNIDVDDIEAEPRGSLLKDDGERSSRLEIHQYSGNRELISNKYAAIREENRQTSSLRSAENTTSSAKVSLLNSGSSDSTACDTGAQSSGLSSTWQTMKTGFHSFRAKIGSKKFLPLKQAQETTIVLRDSSSSESLDDIFQRLKRPPLEQVTFSDDEDDDFGIKDLSSRR